jgi:cell division septal protein FtsQ
MTQAPAADPDLTIKRRRRRKPRANATPKLWRGLRTWARDGRLLAALMAAGCAAALGYFLLSPDFTIQVVYARGNQVLTSEEAVEYSQVTGANLFLLNAGAVQQRLLQVSYVDRVRVERFLPNQVRLTITEDLPSVSWCPLASPERYLVDDDGLIQGVEQPAMSNLIYIVDLDGTPVETGGQVDADAVRTAQWVFSRLYNDLGITLLPFEYQSGRGITAVSTKGWRALFGNSDDLEQKIRNLALLLQDEIAFNLVDLRLPNQLRYE